MTRERIWLRVVMLAAMIVFAVVVLKAISIYETRGEQQSEMVEFVEVKVQQLQTSQIQVQPSENTETVVTKQERQRQLLIKFNSERRLLAQVIFCEAGADERYDMIYAGSVFLNRARTSYHTYAEVNTLYEVLMQKIDGEAQYGEMTRRKVEANIEPPISAYKIADGLLNGTIPILYEGILFQVGHELDETELAEWGVRKIELRGAVHNYYIPDDYYPA